jgi:hypothetical protein
MTTLSERTLIKRDYILQGLSEAHHHLNAETDASDLGPKFVVAEPRRPNSITPQSFIAKQPMARFLADDGDYWSVYNMVKKTQPPRRK